MSRLLSIKIEPISPVTDVITVSEAKQYCRVDFADDDTLFIQLIASSRQRLERYTCRVFLPSNCSAIYNQECGGDRILLSYSDNILLDAGSDYIDSLVGDVYIETCDKKVELEYTSGYDETPEWIKQAVLMDVAWRYENRGDVAATVIDTEVKDYLMPYVKWAML
jgi:hypothetical protein